VEGDEVYVVAGHKGYPEIVRKLGRTGRRRRLKGARGRGTLDKEKPPIFGLFQRNGEVALQMLPNVQQATIHPIIMSTVKPGSQWEVAGVLRARLLEAFQREGVKTPWG